MDINTLTSARLKQAIDLLSKKELLQNQLAGIDEQIVALLGGAPASPQKPARAKAKTGKVRVSKIKGRGALKEGILAVLKAAGPEGASVRELVDKLDSKSANVHAWFNATGKKMPEIQKIGRGIYRLEE